MSVLHECFLDVHQRGQVFTPLRTAAKMASLLENKGPVLEPSCGEGVFLDVLRERDVTAIELDSSISPSQASCTDFFSFSQKKQFQSIIGNPPYVRFQDILPTTKRYLEEQYISDSVFDGRTNLYLFFINKCLDHLPKGGEIVFITPRDFLKATSARSLNERLYKEGSFTHFIDLGDQKIFAYHTPSCAIWRWVRGRKQRTLYDGRTMHYQRGQIYFSSDKKKGTPLSYYFTAHVGAVSGADSLFTSPKGNVEFVCSRTRQEDVLRRMIYDTPHESLLLYKKRLLERKIRAFDNRNWWQWGRKCVTKVGERIYVNSKTRSNSPFFTHSCTHWDGSVLALFPKRSSISVSHWVEVLNRQDWRMLGFMSGGRYLFSQRSLENAVVDVS